MSIFLYYDNLFKQQILDLKLLWPSVALCSVAASTYFFFEARKRPGYICLDQNTNAKIVRQEQDYTVYEVLDGFEIIVENNLPPSCLRQSQQDSIEVELNNNKKVYFSRNESVKYSPFN